MVSTNSNGEYPYPSIAWSVGRMRKKGQKPNGNSEDQEPRTRLAMDYQRRGQPDTSLAETERAAGFGLAARGGSTAARSAVTRGAESLSPDVIQQQKAQIQAMGNHWINGTIDWQKFNRHVEYHGWNVLWAPLDMMPTGGPVMTRRDFLIQGVQEDLAPMLNAKSKEEMQDLYDNPKGFTGKIRKMVTEELKSGKTMGEIFGNVKKAWKDNSIGLQDPAGEMHVVPLDRSEEQGQ
jgi:hypothetical protein